MIDLTSLGLGAIVGYVICAYSVSRYIANRTQEAIDEHIAAATYLFVNEKTKEATRININIPQRDD